MMGDQRWRPEVDLSRLAIREHQCRHRVPFLYDHIANSSRSGPRAQSEPAKLKLAIASLGAQRQ